MENEKLDEDKPCTSRELEKEKGDEERTKRRRRSRSRSSEYTYSSEGSAREEHKPGPLVLHEGTRKMRLVKKKAPRRSGRVTKRRRPTKVRRRPREKPQREHSVTSITSQLSGGSVVRHMSCKYCGHRCCLRRFESQKRSLENKRKRRRLNNFQELRANRSYKRRVQKRRPNNRRRVQKRKVKFNRRVEKFQLQIRKSQPSRRQLGRLTESTQAGAPCPMLSKLFIASNSTPEPDPPEERQMYSEVTPEMIFESLRELAMWRDGVSTETIYNHIKKKYPVNPDPKEVMSDLLEKLRVASIAGIVWSVSHDHWRLTTELESINKLDKTHVTLFWRAYGDTMKPLDRSLQPALKIERDHKQMSTEEMM